MSEVAGGCQELGKFWKEDFTGTETIAQLESLGASTVLKCYSSDILKRIGTLAGDIEAAVKFHAAFFVKFVVSQETAKSVFRGAATLLEGRVLQSNRFGDLARQKHLSTHYLIFKQQAKKYDLKEDQYAEWVHPTLLAIVKTVEIKK